MLDEVWSPSNISSNIFGKIKGSFRVFLAIFHVGYIWGNSSNTAFEMLYEMLDAFAPVFNIETWLRFDICVKDVYKMHNT